jgi:hypothetical protein
VSYLRECVLCGRQGTREFEPASATTWRCANRDRCERRQETAEHGRLPGLVEPVSTDEEPAAASAAMVAALAREVEALRRAVDQAAAVAGRVEELAALVARLAEDIATQTAAEQAGPLSWLDFATDTAGAVAVLSDLAKWMGTVYLRYSDAVQGLPACWLWHPDVVEELLWLMQSWQAAYRSPGAPVSLAGDWHDRLRPGVVRRIKAAAGACSLENHMPGGERHAAGPAAPLAEAADVIARWWATDRESAAPEPTEQQLAAVAAVRRGGRR